MIEIIDMLRALSQELQTIKTGIDILRESRVERLKNTWIDNQDVMQMLHISQRTLQTLRSNGTIPYSRLRGKFYYKVADIEKLLQDNYYNPNFKCDGYK